MRALFHSRSPLTRALLAIALFVGVAAVDARDLFPHIGSHLASDPYDPALNATILWWNATVTPFTARWWTQPFFFPTDGVTTFTEHLAGLIPIASPVYGLTHNPVLAYNVTFFLSWPLSAFGACVLVQRLTRRFDAAILGGLAFGFSPYRTAELGHLQSLCAYGLPLALAGLHGYVDERQRRWLLVFGAAWLIQSLTDGYYMLFGAVLIGVWLLYFCSARHTRSAAVPIVAAWVVSSLPLVPVLLRYQAVHEHYGLRRQYFEALAFSAHPDSWLQVSSIVGTWSRVLSDGSDDLFPGLTAVLLTAAAVVVVAGRRSATPDRPGRRLAKRLLALAVLLSGAALLTMLARGPWSIEWGAREQFKMPDPYRALIVLVMAGVALATLSRRLRAALAVRRPLPFYAGATVLMALCACGPVLSTHDHVLIASAPFRWLMLLPGFDQVRVPARFWMLGVLCLAACAGLSYRSVAAARPRLAPVLFVLACGGLLADGWLATLPVAAAPAVWPGLAREAAGDLPLLELPLGPDWDSAATFRTTSHGRRVFNGVSGYDPPHYAPMREALNARDPEILRALASLGRYDIVINPQADADRQWEAYAAAAPGATRVPIAEAPPVYRVPATAWPEMRVGPALTIAKISSSRGEPSPVIDHRLDTDWVDHPQHPDQWLLADLGTTQLVGGISLAIEEHAGDFPRHLRIERSIDGEQWSDAWDGNAASRVFLAALREPRTGWLRIEVPASPARFVRIRQTATASIGWRVPELEVNAPAR